jgi:hypothetical protein
MTKSTNVLSSTHRPALSAFMAKVLEPVTDAELVDTQYNSLVRNVRAEAWRKAKIKTEYYSALKDAASCLECKGKPAFEFNAVLPSRADLLDLYRAALAEQLLTPAFQKLDIDWKKRQLPKLNRYIPVRPEDVAASIKADEEFFASHPTRRERTAR